MIKEDEERSLREVVEDTIIELKTRDIDDKDYVIEKLNQMVYFLKKIKPEDYIKKLNYDPERIVYNWFSTCEYIVSRSIYLDTEAEPLDKLTELFEEAYKLMYYDDLP